MKYTDFRKFCIENRIKFSENEPMNLHTSFKTGGPADIFIKADCEEQVVSVLKACENLGIPVTVVGKGSNLLVSDYGIEGVVLSLSGMDNITVSGDMITAESGASLASVCIAAANAGLSGLEFAYGIPGSVGGALYMNAGAYGGEMSQVVQRASTVSFKGKQKCYSIEEMVLGYRTSAFKKGGEIITSVTFKLTDDIPDKIRGRMNDFMSRRREKQPLEYPSAGSTFKRPEGYFAGALIEKNNLKGVKIGGAMVSEKHAGFIINYNNATTEDIIKLIVHIRNVVLTADGVELEPEVIFIGKKQNGKNELWN